MFRLDRILPTAFLAAAFAFSPLLLEEADAKNRKAVSTKPNTHVYLMRGLFGIFSLGMDDLADKLKKDGFRAEVFGWDSWPQVTEKIESDFRHGENEVVVIGHSLGANAVFQVADRLQSRGIPVLMGVTFDATEPGQVPVNVSTFVNFWAEDGFGHPVRAPAGYTGVLEDYDLSGQPGIDHTSIDAMDRFHVYIIEKLDELVIR